MKAAIKLKENMKGFRGVASLYHLTEPLEGFEYVVVSSITTIVGPETFIFGADKEGVIQDWNDLPGSLRGSLEHSDALSRAGYEYVPQLQ